MAKKSRFASSAIAEIAANFAKSHTDTDDIDDYDDICD